MIKIPFFYSANNCNFVFSKNYIYIVNTNASNNRRIAKNAIYLYLRMLITIVVGLYTSRVVLSTLGIDDYGIYGVVGSVIAMAGFLNSSMAGATSRFITVELGRGNKERLKHTFGSALTIHIGIALIIIILGETIGLWFLNNKLDIPINRISAAHWIYQFSILSAAIGVNQVPYNACIIAHERMGVYAYVEIINSVLRLLIVYLLTIGDFDKLILYGALSATVSIIILLIYQFYCLRQFPECRTTPTLNKELLKPMLSFSGWDMYGNLCVTARSQGLNFILNIFFGVALNAANSIATTINGAIGGLCTNITQAFRPQIIKNYANGDIQQSQTLINNSSTYTLLLLGCIGIPAILETDYLLKLWLGNPPAYAGIFCKILIAQSFFGLANNSLTAIIHATGKIKGISLISGTLYLLCLPAIYLGFKYHLQVQWAYWCFGASTFLILASNIVISKRLVPQLSATKYIFKVLICGAIITIAATPGLFIVKYLEPSIWRLCLTTLVAIFIIGFATYTFVISAKTRSNINSRVSQALHLKTF